METTFNEKEKFRTIKKIPNNSYETTLMINKAIQRLLDEFKAKHGDYKKAKIVVDTTDKRGVRIGLENY